jgi:hypothetical protein
MRSALQLAPTFLGMDRATLLFGMVYLLPTNEPYLRKFQMQIPPSKEASLANPQHVRRESCTSVTTRKHSSLDQKLNPCPKLVET